MDIGFTLRKMVRLDFMHIKDSVAKFKKKLRIIANRSNGKSRGYVKLKLRQIGQGWLQYFKLADMKEKLKTIDEWLRRRIRMRVWKTWKRVRTRYKYLQKLGINKYKAWQWANTRKGYWRVAGSFILTRTLTNERIAKQGYISLLDYYKLVKI